MPEVAEAFSHLEALDLPNLLVRYEELKDSLVKLPDGRPDPNASQDDIKLQEMCVILANLRRRSAGPPKARKGASGSKPSKQKAPLLAPSLDDL